MAARAPPKKSPKRGVYLIVYNKESTGRVKYFTLNCYKGISLNGHEVVVNLTRDGKFKSQSEIKTEIDGCIQDIRDEYPAIGSNYLNAKILDDSVTIDKTQFYFVSPIVVSDNIFTNFPGGKQESGESDDITLEREVQQELGINIRPFMSRMRIVPTKNRTFYLLNYNDVTSVEMRLFIQRAMPSNLKTFGNADNIETSEAYSSQWRYFTDFAESDRNKFIDGMIDAGDADALASAKPHKSYSGYRPGGNQDIYYMKYLKYKAKYLKLKESMKI